MLLHQVVRYTSCHWKIKTSVCTGMRRGGEKFCGFFVTRTSRRNASSCSCGKYITSSCRKGESHRLSTPGSTFQCRRYGKDRTTERPRRIVRNVPGIDECRGEESSKDHLRGRLIKSGGGPLLYKWIIGHYNGKGKSQRARGSSPKTIFGKVMVFHFSSTRYCPDCYGLNVRKSSRCGLFESLMLRSFLLRPYRCELCDCRYYGLISAARIREKEVEAPKQESLAVPVQVCNGRKKSMGGSISKNPACLHSGDPSEEGGCQPVPDRDLSLYEGVLIERSE